MPIKRLLELHEQYGPVVRVGLNEVSIGSWKYYRALYGNPKTSTKQLEFYGAATFVGKDNIFQMTYVQGIDSFNVKQGDY